MIVVKVLFEAILRDDNREEELVLFYPCCCCRTLNDQYSTNRLCLLVRSFISSISNYWMCSPITVSLDSILRDIEMLMQEGKLTEALQEVEKLEQSGYLKTEQRANFWQALWRRRVKKQYSGEDLESNPRLWCLTLKSTLLGELGKSQEALRIAEEAIEEARKNKKNPSLLMDALRSKANVLSGLGQLTESLEAANLGLQLLEPMNRDQRTHHTAQEAGLLLAKGKTLRLKGDLEKAFECFEQSLLFFKELSDKRMIAESIISIAIIYYYQGEFDKALDYLQQCLKLFEEIGHKQNIARTLNVIGGIFFGKGELDLAIDYYQKSLTIKKEIGNNQEIAITLTNLGGAYHKKGELDKGLKLLQQSYALLKEIGNNQYTAYNLLYLISITIDMSALKEAEQYLQVLQEIDAKDDNMGINQKSRLAEAMLLKTSTRARNRGRAEELLYGIIEEEITDHEVTVDAMLYLCELLLMDLKTSGTEEVLHEVKALTNRLQDIAKEQQSHLLIAETYLLQAKLALLGLDMEIAHQLLMQAEQLAKEYGLQNLERKISAEHDFFLAQENEWNEAKEREASLAELMELAQIDDSLRLMLRKTVDIPEIVSEDPLMFIILAETGLSLFSKTFETDKNVETINEQLIAGFLSAINAFSGRVFSSSLDRARLGDYSLVMKPVEDIMLICYVFKGATYPALQKVTQFIHIVRANDLAWKGLMKALEGGHILDASEREVIDGLLMEVFLAT